ncbi:MAG: 16S rRNA (guanine(527)-N(7))-methyltransferase RsmG [Deltaproteobacteria bacterium]|nr:16S rRNA (guanine(527)-N(7))-methyltransferase RsmG [Deltaproteobacteria bacterium]
MKDDRLGNGTNGRPAWPVQDVLDLHAFSPKDVQSLIEEYIYSCHQAGLYNVRIVHGKGKGILRERVRALLRRHPVVTRIAQAPGSAGGWGASLVEIKRADPFEREFAASLDKGAREMGVFLDSTQIGQMTLHAAALRRWRRMTNLTGLSEPTEMAEKLFLDSIPAAACMGQGARVLDLGSGGGFPGVPLKVIRPDLRVTLLDAKRKKVSFLKYIIGLLGIKGIEAYQGRAEDFADGGQLEIGYFDTVVSRAVGSLESVVRLSSRWLEAGTVVLAMKGPGVNDEIASVREPWARAGLLVETRAYRLPVSGIARTLVAVTQKGA